MHTGHEVEKACKYASVVSGSTVFDHWFSLQRSISVHDYMIKAVYAVIPVKKYITLELYSFVMKLNTCKYSEGGG